MKDSTRMKHIIQKMLKKYTTRLAKDVTQEIEIRYETAITRFYVDYFPKVYRRTYSTYLASDHYRHAREVEIEGDKVIAGINVASDNIPGQPYVGINRWSAKHGEDRDKDWVFQRTFVKGIHGIDRGYRDYMNKNKKGIQTIQGMLDYILASKETVEKEYKRYKSDVFSAKKNKVRGPNLKNMSNPPKKQFEKMYNEMIKNGTVEKMEDVVFADFFDQVLAEFNK